MLARRTRTEFRMLVTLLVIGLTLMALTGCSEAAAGGPPEPRSPYVAAPSAEVAGEYLTVVGGCNDCHTPKWDETFGQVPNEDRLVGVDLGFRGPWGTSYPSNLRLSVQNRTGAEWIAMIRGRKGMPPMPWMNLHQMPDRDLNSIYAYLRALGPKGEPAPAFVPPGQEPRTPYIRFEPISPKVEN